MKELRKFFKYPAFEKERWYLIKTTIRNSLERPPGPSQTQSALELSLQTIDCDDASIHGWEILAANSCTSAADDPAWESGSA